MSRSPLESYTEEDAKKSWELLEDAISKIYEKKYFELSYEELYRNCYYLVLHKHGEKTYQRVEKCMRLHLKKYHQTLMQMPEGDFLDKFSEIWSDIREMIKGIAQIYLYMDRNYVPTKLMSPVKILGYRIFLEVFFENEACFRRFQHQIIGLIRSERDGMRVDRLLLKNLLTMLLELGAKAEYPDAQATPSYGVGNKGNLVTTQNYQARKITFTVVETYDVYRKYFEEDFLAETKSYYEQEAQRGITSMEATEYLHKAETRSQEEIDRLNFYLSVTTRNPLIKVFMEVYIVRHSKTIADTEGLPILFDAEKLEEVRKIYKMFLFHPEATNLFDNIFLAYQKKHVKKILSTSMEDENVYLLIVKHLLDFHKKIEKISKAIQDKDFERNKMIAKLTKNAFEEYMNMNQKAPFALNFYLDYQFREGYKCLQDSEVETSLLDILTLFRYISDKDVFEKTYKAFLSKRLLAGRSLSEENEKLFITKLQQECGSYFTTKIETMFKDIALSRDIMSEFYAKYSNSVSFESAVGGKPGELGKPFEVKVLTAGNWTFPDSPECSLVTELNTWKSMFENFYKNKYAGRSLKWVFSQGSAELKGIFGGKKKEILVTTYQMCILMLFNSRQSMKVKEINSLTNLPIEEVQNHLAAFLSVKIMSKVPQDGEIDEDNTIAINDEFIHKSYRIKIPIKKKKEKIQDDEKKILDTVAVERKYWVEACIVRIMKSRKRLEHAQLIEEVIKLATLYQFKPNFTLIKGVIEELIAKEYIDRAPDTKNVYIYLS